MENLGISYVSPKLLSPKLSETFVVLWLEFVPDGRHAFEERTDTARARIKE